MTVHQAKELGAYCFRVHTAKKFVQVLDDLHKWSFCDEVRIHPVCCNGPRTRDGHARGGRSPFDAFVSSHHRIGQWRQQYLFQLFSPRERRLSLSGTGSGNGNGFQTATANAAINLDATSLFQLYGASTNSGAGDFVPDGHAFAAAGWKDIVFLSGGSGPAPPTIRLHLTMQGQLDVSAFAISFPSSVMMGLTSGYSDDLTQLNSGEGDGTRLAGFIAINRFGGGDYHEDVRGLSNVSGAPGGTFTADWTYDVSYSSVYGGYYFDIDAIVSTYAQAGAASADFSHTINLSGVTLTDGTPINGLTFDSGLQFPSSSNAVPEPGTLTLFGIGAVGLLTYGWRRKQAAVSSN